MTMKLILGDRPIEEKMPFSITRKIVSDGKKLKIEGKTKSELQAFVRNYLNATNWYKKLNAKDKEIIDKTSLDVLFRNGLKNENVKYVNMKIEFDRILELIKIALLVIIVILLSLNYYGGGSQSKYELYKNGRIRLNKVTGETYIRDHDGNEFVKMKIKE